MQCNQPIPGDGVPTTISNPQSHILMRLQAEVDAAHAILSDHKVPWQGSDGALLSLRERVVAALASRRWPPPLPPLPSATEIEAISQRLAFDDDDPFLPATSSEGAAGMGFICAAVWTLYGAAIVLGVVLLVRWLA
ncbi:MAG: hypothetical protein RJA36_787 [Pseudomonadota bacterium]|jgi:hypothetical protein